MRRDPDGNVTTVAGGGGSLAEPPAPEDGQVAIAPTLSASDVAVGPDGSLYVADRASGGVYAVGGDGTLRVVASGEDLGIADQSAGGLDVAEDGTVYVSDARSDGGRVLRISRSGEVTTVAGGSEPHTSGSTPEHGSPATPVGLPGPADVVAATDGSL